MSADPNKIELARQLMSELGVSWADLGSLRSVPSVADYLPAVMAAASSGQRKTYGPYWRRAVELFGDRPLDNVRPSDVLALQRLVVYASRVRRGRRNGRHAGESCLRAMRSYFRMAAADGLISADANPAVAVPLPRRLPSPRRALTSTELELISNVVAVGGNDVPLDCLLFRLHVETACRRGGALSLEVQDLCLERCAIRLREKGGTVRWQPISPTLASALDSHAVERGARRPTDSLLRYSNHHPLTGRRYDALWARVRRELPWADQYGISVHWLRHTTITWVERQFGYGVARAYAGHTDAKGGSTLTYIKGLPREVATALSVLTGEPHPLALPPAAAKKIRR